ncbi:MAG: biotin/lipoyl-containing protein [Bacillota bacterium]|nr:biotin/lipoyl-containing protein [Bacillota bacterium]
MKIEFIKELVKIVDNSSIQELDYSSNNERIMLAKFNKQRYENKPAYPVAQALNEAGAGLRKDLGEAAGMPDTEQIAYGAEAPIQTDVTESGGAEKQTADPNTDTISSTMIGTFYSKPSPEEEPYVSVGSTVKKGDVLCIIESMKMMNEIKSPFDCEILEVLAGEEEVVEYGQELFSVRKL